MGSQTFTASKERKRPPPPPNPSPERQRTTKHTLFSGQPLTPQSRFKQRRHNASGVQRKAKTISYTDWERPVVLYILRKVRPERPTDVVDNLCHKRVWKVVFQICAMRHGHNRRQPGCKKSNLTELKSKLGGHANRFDKAYQSETAQASGGQS